jgi:FKBP-type peptidyl-prolyl cis-trans isomerase FkpA
MLKKILLILILMISVTAAWQCSKSNSSNCTNVPVANEDAAMQQYMTANNITGVKDASGLYYQIITQGTGAGPTLNSKIAVKYKGVLTNGTVFDQLNTVDPNPGNWWGLSSLIAGWQIGIPKIGKGGQIKLIVPSSLGYGCKALPSIPSNSILVFDVELVDFY